MMARIFSILLNIIITSLFLFPFEFTFLPGVNTKMALAAIGVVILTIKTVGKKNASIDISFLGTVLLASLVSIAAYVATVINNTNDYTYVSYVISMLVWMGGAYTMVLSIQATHKDDGLVTIPNYLIAVCCLQCILALIINRSPIVSMYVNTYISNVGFAEMDQLIESGRLYGIGCALDVAGTRFATVLIIIAFLTSLHNRKPHKKWLIPLYLLAFCFITVIGNMIARTTLLGVIFAGITWILFPIVYRSDHKGTKSNGLAGMILISVCVAVIICTSLYNSSPVFRDNIRFGFEGFFSLVEKGHWETNSNNILKNMIVWPETLHTWIIGDGYLNNPLHRDPNYIGKVFHGYYMQTDIGYIRFIFYFGLVGLLCFMLFFVGITSILNKRFPEYKLLFICFLSLNFIIWMKVSTDIFLIFAIFLCIPFDETAVTNDETDFSHQLTQ